MIEVDWWDDNRQIIRLRYVGEWDWTQYYEARRWMSKLLYSVNHPVIVLIDHRESDYTPPDIAAHTVTILGARHYNVIGAVWLAVPQTHEHQQMQRVLNKIRPQSMDETFHTASIDDALAYVRRRLSE